MRNATIVGCLFVAAIGSGCSFVDDFGGFTFSAADASVDGGVPIDLGPDGSAQDLGADGAVEPDLGSPDAGPVGHVVDLVAGTGFTCALFDSGRVRCWGSNASGTLGNGDPSGPPGIAEANPQEVIGLPGRVLQLAAGQAHVCAVVAVGASSELYCWGDNSAGQFGAGTTSVYVSTPQRVELDWTPRAVAAGNSFTCALDADSSVYCAGSNSDLQLGQPSSTVSSTTFARTSTFGSSDATLVAGYANVCMLTPRVGAACWGDGSGMQLGRTDPSDSDAPQGVGTSPVRLAIGTQHMCAVSSSNSVECWGAGVAGQLGDGVFASSADPLVPTSGTLGFAQFIAASDYHTCAIYKPSTTAEVYCWGLNAAGVCGLGSATGNVGAPRKIDTITDAVRLATGTQHACALTGSGAVYCWGSSSYSELGPGATAGTESPTPVLVTGLD